MLLTVRNYQKSYRGYPILTVNSLDIEAGIHWFEGINGSGKSTFFKTVAGIIPFEGEISLLDVPNNRKNAVRYRELVSYAYAEPQYPDYLSGAEIIEFVRKTRKATSLQINELVEAFGIADYYKNPIQTYSSGMLKKVALLTAFVGNAALILLDEPFTTIDSRTSTLLYMLIREKAAAGRSFFIASHQQLIADEIDLTGHFKVENGSILC